MTEPAFVPHPNRNLILAFLMTTMALSSIEGTIVATAMPSIVSSLGGFELYAWAFSGFLLTQAVFTQILGKWSDIVGRKPVLMISVAVFLIASIACGFATSMEMLIFMRLVQGIGAGGIGTTVSTLAADLYTVRERGNIQAMFSAVWGVSSVLGPLLGGIMVQNFHWAWVFWFSVPFGLVATWGIWRYLTEDFERKPQRIDLPGSFGLLLSMSALMYMLNLGTNLITWIGLLGGGGLLLWRLRTAADPIMPRELWRDKFIFLATFTGFVGGLMMTGLIAYIPAYVQGVMGATPMIAGFALTTLSLGWPVASSIGGRMIIPRGPTLVVRLAGIAALIGGGLYAMVRPDLGPAFVATAAFFVGAALGFANTTIIVSVQSVVPWNRRGGVTAVTILLRLLGNSLGAAMLGGILNRSLYAGLAEERFAGVSMREVEGLMNADPAAAGIAVDPAVRTLLAESLQGLHLIVFGIAIVFFVMTLLWPRGKRLV